MTSNRRGVQRPDLSSSGCWQPKKKPRYYKNAFAPCARRRNRPEPSGRSVSLPSASITLLRRMVRSDRPPIVSRMRPARAIRALPGGRGDQVEQGQPSYFVPPTEFTESLAAVIAGLQAKIQEMIVENSLVERNGPVPPEYKKLVEDYYRVLSQDLR